jgi:hypothetical protein
MAFTKLEPNSVNTLATFEFANIKTDHITFANGQPWQSAATPVAAGSDSQVQYNDENSFAGDANFTYNSTTGTLTVSNIISDGAGLSNIAGSVITGNVAVAAVANYVTGGNVSGDVAGASHANVSDVANSVSGGNVSGAVAFATVANSVSGSNVSGQVSNALITGTVYTNAQPNITSLGTLTSLTVSGNANVGNIGSTSGVFTGNVTITGNLIVSGTTTTVNNENISSANTLITLHDPGTPLTNNDGKDIGILMRVFTTQDEYAFLGRASSSGDFEYYKSGSINESDDFVGSYGNIRGSSFVSVATTGSQPLRVNSTTQVTNLHSEFSGAVTTAAQPNITSVGILSNLTVSGNITSGNANLGNLTKSNFFSGNGSLITNINGANVTGTVANATYAATSGASGNLSTTSDNTTNASYYPVFQTAAGGTSSIKVSTGLSFNPGTSTLSTTNITSSNGNIANLTVTNSAHLGALTNLKITGGLPGYTITTDGLGNLTWGTGTPSGGTLGGAGFITVTKDTFTASGSANTYTLSITPASVAYIVVNIDGIVQQVSSYSLSSDVVTLSGMPASGEVIEITSYGVGGLPGGSTTQLQFNDGGVFQGSPYLTFNTSTSTLTASKFAGNGAGLINLTGANVTGFVPNANVSNTAFTVTTAAQPNITSVGSLTSLTVTGNVTSSNANLGNLVIANYHSGDGSLLSNITGGNVTGTVANATYAINANMAAYSANVTASSQPNITSLGSLTSLTVAGLTTAQLTSEVLVGKTGAGGVVLHDVTTSSIFYHTGIGGNFTANFTNVPTTANRSTVVILVLIQGSVPYIPNAVQIDGTAQTINWAGSAAPVGFANKKDIVAFTFLRTGGAWTVFGQLASYG